jgi:hypothetical protein
LATTSLRLFPRICIVCAASDGQDNEGDNARSGDSQMTLIHCTSNAPAHVRDLENAQMNEIGEGPARSLAPDPQPRKIAMAAKGLGTNDRR